MKITKTEIVPQTTVKRVIGELCDRCGKEVGPVGDDNHFSVTIEMEHGSHWPGAQNVDGWEIEDCCFACAEVVREALVGLGFKITTFDRSY